jgi:hypothetical protein
VEFSAYGLQIKSSLDLEFHSSIATENYKAGIDFDLVRPTIFKLKNTT